jgi:hypothetical protein
MKKSSAHVLSETQAAYTVSSGVELEFPDWRGHRASRSKLTKEQMRRYCEAILPLAKSKPGYAEMRRRAACSVEFNLD